MIEAVILGHLQKWIARGYKPQTTWATPAEFVVNEGQAIANIEDAVAALRNASSPSVGVDQQLGIGMIAPTQVARSSLAEQQAYVGHVLDRLEEVRQTVTQVSLILFVGMQWRMYEEREESLRRLRVLARAAGDRRSGIRFIGVSMPGPGKIRTLNVAIQVAQALDLAGLGWMDDDIKMDHHCLERMVASFLEQGCRGAVGATKIPHAKPYITSRLLHRAKAIATPATNYPHGCCILVATEVVAGGIPDRYVSDDGYVCFRLLKPELADPLQYLHLVPDARCHYHVAGPARETAPRIRRLLLNHHIFMADWPLPVARYYFSQVLFHGLWPLAGWDAKHGFSFGLKKALIKWLYFCWFAKVGAELYLRGLLDRPLRRVGWGEYSSVDITSLPSVQGIHIEAATE